MRQTDRRTFVEHCGRPERVVWAVAQAEGKRSICPLGWKMNTSHNPWMMAISVAPSRFTHGLIEKAGAFVLAWPGVDLAEATYLCGTTSGRDVDKFEACGLTAVPSETVSAPLVAECAANLECRLDGSLASGDHTVFTGEVVRIHLHDEPSPPLLLVNGDPRWEVVLEKGIYRFGTAKG